MLVLQGTSKYMFSNFIGAQSIIVLKITLILDTRQMLIQSWHTGFYWLHATIDLGFDASAVRS